MPLKRRKVGRPPKAKPAEVILSDSTDYVCEVCSRQFDTKVSLARHEKHCEQRRLLVFTADSIKKAKYVCRECNKNFRFKKSYELHLQNDHAKGPDSVGCRKCSVRCPDKVTLKNHIANVHERTIYTCEHCNKKFVRRAHVMRHKAQKGCDGRGVSIFNCEICDASFTRKDNLIVHLRYQHIVKNAFVCKQCPFHSQSFSRLIIHFLRMHADNGTTQEGTTTTQSHVPVELHDAHETTSETALQADENEPPQLDPDLLLALGDITDEQPTYGEKIHQSLAQRWIPLLKKGLAKDLKDNIFKEYQIPENCKLLKAPALNPEIKAAVSDIVINRDKNIQSKQDQLGLGITAINKAITLLLLGGDKIQAIKILSDSCRILTDLHYSETQVRTKLITPCLDKSFTPLIKDHERVETLFGENLSESIKASKAIERQGSLIKKPIQRTTSLPAFSAGGSSFAKSRFVGNETGPPRFTSVSRGGRGYPRSATAFRRQATTTRPQGSPKRSSQDRSHVHTQR